MTRQGLKTNPFNALSCMALPFTGAFRDFLDETAFITYGLDAEHEDYIPDQNATSSCYDGITEL